MANNRKTEARAPGLAASGLVDPIETLENSVDVTSWNSNSLIGHFDDNVIRNCFNRHINNRSGIGILDGIVDEVADCRKELSALTDDSGIGRQDDQLHRYFSLNRGSSESFNRVRGNLSQFNDGAASTIDRFDSRKFNEIFDDLSDSHRLGINAIRKALNDVEVIFALEGLREETNCTNRGLQLMADVGNKIGTNGLELAPFGDVFDKCDRSWLPILRERNRSDQNRASRRPKEFDRGGGFATRIRHSDEIIHRSANKRIAMAGLKERLGSTIRLDNRTLAVKHHHGYWQSIESRLQAKLCAFGLKILGSEITYRALDNYEKIIEAHHLAFAWNLEAQTHRRLVDMITLGAIPKEARDNGCQSGSYDSSNQRTPDH